MSAKKIMGAGGVAAFLAMLAVQPSIAQDTGGDGQSNQKQQVSELRTIEQSDKKNYQIASTTKARLPYHITKSDKKDQYDYLDFGASDR